MAQRRNAQQTFAGRLNLIRRIDQGGPIAQVADEMGSSQMSVQRWWSRPQAEGETSLHEKPSATGSRRRRTR
jgi:transposase